MPEITDKKYSGYYLNKFREYFPDDYDFFPRTFLIPEELDVHLRVLQVLIGEKENMMIYQMQPQF